MGLQGFEQLAAEVAIAHVNVRRETGEAREGLAFLERLAALEIVDGRPQLALELARHARLSLAVDHETGHALPAAAASDARLLRMHPETLRVHDSLDQAQQRLQFRLAL